jgi:hypothetical protein
MAEKMEGSGGMSADVGVVRGSGAAQPPAQPPQHGVAGQPLKGPVMNDISGAVKNDVQAAKDAAQELRDVLNRMVHTSPADVGHAVVEGTGNVVHGTLNNLHHLITWLEQQQQPKQG